MKSLFFVSFLIFSNLLIADTFVDLNIKVIGSCSGVPLFENTRKVKLGDSLGVITLKVFKENGIAFMGTERGMNSIFNSPVGDEALEVFGRKNEKMRAYGWCFSVNSKVPMLYANEVFVDKEGIELIWFSSYAFFDRDKPVTMCHPTYNLRPPFLCAK